MARSLKPGRHEHENPKTSVKWKQHGLSITFGSDFTVSCELSGGLTIISSGLILGLLCDEDFQKCYLELIQAIPIRKKGK